MTWSYIFQEMYKDYRTHISEVEMTLTGLILLLLVAGIVGAVGQSLSGYSFGGCLVSIIVGFIGAYVGVWLAGQLGLPEVFSITIEGESFPIVWGIIGSAILSLILGLFTSRRRYF
jgi:uncharacterized membrane protein YeaQ/YmgE (transglycosylase-associated protein family)